MRYGQLLSQSEGRWSSIDAGNLKISCTSVKRKSMIHLNIIESCSSRRSKVGFWQEVPHQHRICHLVVGALSPVQTKQSNHKSHISAMHTFYSRIQDYIIICPLLRASPVERSTSDTQSAWSNDRGAFFCCNLAAKSAAWRKTRPICFRSRRSPHTPPRR
jgi:hypothetical protein